MQLRPDVYSYGLDWEYEEPLGVHVVATDDATVLFGAGAEETADELAGIATEHGVDGIVVEHGDGDHFGGVPPLREALGDVEVAVPAGDASSLEEAGIAVDRALEPGARVHGVETIAAPGHTPDNMAYLYADVLLAGDTVAGSESMFAAEGEWTGPLAVMTADYNADDAAARDSVSRLLEYDVEVVLVTHGENVDADGREAVERLVADLE